MENQEGKNALVDQGKKCLEDVEENIKEIGIRCWRKHSQDRQDWTSVVWQALFLEGP